MSLLTTVTLEWKAHCAEDFSILRDIKKWLDERRKEGYTIIVKTHIGIADDATLYRLTLNYHGTFRFVDKRMAAMFKLLFG